VVLHGIWNKEGEVMVLLTTIRTLLALVLLCGSACGQESSWFTKLDVSLCYSYAHFSSSSSSGLGSQSLQGAEMSVSYRLAPWLRVALDFGLARDGNRNNDIVGISLRGTQSNYLLRSCLVLPGGWATPFSQVLWALSGGADYQLTTRFALRPIQLEFLQTNFLELQDNKITQNDLCVSTGVALRF
jgi:hypothetical protein